MLIFWGYFPGARLPIYSHKECSPVRIFPDQPDAPRCPVRITRMRQLLRCRSPDPYFLGSPGSPDPYHPVPDFPDLPIYSPGCANCAAISPVRISRHLSAWTGGAYLITFANRWMAASYSRHTGLVSRACILAVPRRRYRAAKLFLCISRKHVWGLAL